MQSARDSIANSSRMGRFDASPWIAALMLIALGIVISNQILPAWHEQQALAQRNRQLAEQVEAAKAEALRIEDEIEALNDPYYVAAILVADYNYRWDRGAETWRASLPK
ncbi:MAG: hypothetical protein IT462_08335 [Planctomycetes bacterium]|nr:hypothetical protein [Planctomycetota bacterium]